MTPEAFDGFSKIPRLSRPVVITEKIDGTNAQIYISDTMEPFTLGSGRVVPFMCGSRTRYIFPENDNHGFARWAYDHAEELLKLGPGRHFGEWWGAGIQRGYGLKEKRFSLFNVGRWNEENKPECCHVVPVLASLPTLDTDEIKEVLFQLDVQGSKAAPGFMPAEGIVIYHVPSGFLFKKTILKDESPKGKEE